MLCTCAAVDGLDSESVEQGRGEGEGCPGNHLEEAGEVKHCCTSSQAFCCLLWKDRK